VLYYSVLSSVVQVTERNVNQASGKRKLDVDNNLPVEKKQKELEEQEVIIKKRIKENLPKVRGIEGVNVCAVFRGQDLVTVPIEEVLQYLSVDELNQRLAEQEIKDTLPPELGAYFEERALKPENVGNLLTAEDCRVMKIDRVEFRLRGWPGERANKQSFVDLHHGIECLPMEEIMRRIRNFNVDSV
jgi:hypothetical protein